MGLASFPVEQLEPPKPPRAFIVCTSWVGLRDLAMIGDEAVLPNVQR